MVKTYKKILSLFLIIALIISLSISALATVRNTTFTVKKVWSSSQTSFPDITFTVKSDGTAMTSQPTPTIVKNGNVWTYTYSVPSGHTYTVTEAPVTDYSTTYTPAAPLSVINATLVNPCSSLSFADIGSAYVVIKLTSNIGYIVWTNAELSSADEISFVDSFQALPNTNSFGITHNNAFFKHGNISNFYGTSFTVSGNSLNLTYNEHSNWAKFAYGSYSQATPFTVINTYAPQYNVSYTDGTTTFSGGNRLAGVNYTVLTFAQTGLPTPTHKHFIGWTNENSVSNNPGDTVAQPAVNVLYTAQFADDPTYTVTYDFTGSLPSPAPTLPTDSNNYYSGDPVTVAPGYSSIYDADNHGTWIFNGWDKGNFNITENTTILGSWRFQGDDTFAVIYEFSGISPSTVSPPTDSTSYYLNDLVTIKDGFASFHDAALHGTWTFNGWIPADNFNITANTTIVGTWNFTADSIYHVTYVFSGTTPTPVPDLPIDGTNYYSGDLVTIASGYSNIVDTLNNGIWYFNGWVPGTDFNITVDTTITGTWTFRENPPQPTYDNLIIEKSVSGFTGEQTPKFEILVTFTQPLTGVEYDDNYVIDNGNGSFTFKLRGGESATLYGVPTGSVYSVTENKSMEQYWSYSSGDVSERTLTTTTTETINNTFGYNPPPPPPPATYPVTYNYVAAAGSGTLPAEISTSTGAFAVSDSNTYYAGASVNRVSTAPAIGTVYAVTGGVWTLTGWSDSPVTMTAPGITFTGTWTFGAVLAEKEKEGAVLAENEKLPQTGGISSSTLLGLFGLALIAVGGTTTVLFRKKNDGKSK